MRSSSLSFSSLFCHITLFVESFFCAVRSLCTTFAYLPSWIYIMASCSDCSLTISFSCFCDTVVYEIFKNVFISRQYTFVNISNQLHPLDFSPFLTNVSSSIMLASFYPPLPSLHRLFLSLSLLLLTWGCVLCPWLFLPLSSACQLCDDKFPRHWMGLAT